MRTLAERINWRLAETGKKKAGLARYAGVAAPSVTNWTNGNTQTLEGTNLVRAAEFLECDPIWLATGVGDWRIKHSLRPVSVWNSENDPSDHKCVFIPTLKVQLSTDSMNLIWHVDETGQHQAFTQAWADKAGIDSACTATMVVSDSSMEPRYKNGDSIIVDYGQDSTVIDGKVYAIALNQETFIKRLFNEVDGSIRIVSDNPDKSRYADKIVSPEFMARLQIIGRVVALVGSAE